MYDVAEPQRHSRRVAADAWAALSAELDLWATAGRTATFWWRDDDGGEMTGQLEQLFALRRRAGVAVALAAVPVRVDAAFSARLAEEADIAVLQHGYSHHNFAADGDRKIELDGSRPAEYVVAELAVGMQALSALPGWAPVLVPPWNRIAPHLLPPLPELGFRGLSALGPRQRANAMPGLRQNNVHIDPIDWRGRFGSPRAFVGDDKAIAAAVGHLAARRTGATDSDEATGLMTHHLVQDGDTWRFVERFIGSTKSHPAARWLAAADVFGLDA